MLAKCMLNWHLQSHCPSWSCIYQFPQLASCSISVLWLTQDMVSILSLSFCTVGCTLLGTKQLLSPRRSTVFVSKFAMPFIYLLVGLGALVTTLWRCLLSQQLVGWAASLVHIVLRSCRLLVCSNYVLVVLLEPSNLVRGCQDDKVLWKLFYEYAVYCCCL